MQLTSNKGILITLFSMMLLVSCSSQKTEEIDLSSLKLTPKKEKKISKENGTKLTPKVVNNLKPLINKDQLNSSIDFGRNNPFAFLEKEKNSELNNLKLTGLLSINNTEYALLNYKDKSGSITTEDVGGISTHLLPDGAKVKEINLKRKILIIAFDQKTFQIYLD